MRRLVWLDSAEIPLRMRVNDASVLSNYLLLLLLFLSSLLNQLLYLSFLLILLSLDTIPWLLNPLLPYLWNFLLLRSFLVLGLWLFLFHICYLFNCNSRRAWGVNSSAILYWSHVVRKLSWKLLVERVLRIVSRILTLRRRLGLSIFHFYILQSLFIGICEGIFWGIFVET